VKERERERETEREKRMDVEDNEFSQLRAKQL
jgi:hypothetical protein